VNLLLKFIQIDWRKVGVQYSLLETVEEHIGVSMVISNWQVQEVLPEATTDLGYECINVYGTGSGKGRMSDIER